ncbi:MAG: hypothetical protein E7638_00045 [Ruminococcaceae bacterium]|nr:hypothetical protein [Oscillospiraceae bacterium]
MPKKATLRFGKGRSTPSAQAQRNRCADTALICGTITAAVFFVGTLSGSSLTADAHRAESVLASSSVPAMSTAVDSSSLAPTPDNIPQSAEEMREILRKNVRDTSGEPFGYMGGQWNLWEYLGDLMADLLVG